MDTIACIGTDHESRCIEEALGRAGLRVQRVVGGGLSLPKGSAFDATEISSQAQQLALLNARLAAARSGLRYGVGISGYRDLDPFVRTLPWACETMAWWDSRRGYAIFESQGKSLSHAFRKLVSDWEGARVAAEQMGFPVQAVSVGSPTDSTFGQGITDPGELRIAVDAALRTGEGTWISLAPEAGHSPWRDELIQDVAVALARRLENRCGICRAVGLSEIRTAESASLRLCHQCGALRATRPRPAKAVERHSRRRGGPTDSFMAAAP